MKESGNLLSADTRILPASHIRGLAKDVEPCRLNIVCWIKTSTLLRQQNLCEDDGYRADVAEKEFLCSDALGCALTVSWIEISR